MKRCATLDASCARLALTLLALSLSWSFASPEVPAPPHEPVPTGDAAMDGPVMTGGAPPPTATPPEVTADLRIAELPFLSPPEQTVPEATGAGEAGSSLAPHDATNGASPTPITDPAGAANPFAALFAPSAEEATPSAEAPPVVTEAPPVPPPPITEVSVPPAPPASATPGPPELSELVPTPTPRPPLTRLESLPRRLEASTAPETPRPLAWGGAAHAGGGRGLAGLAALRAPALEVSAPVAQRPTASSAAAAGAPTPALRTPFRTPAPLQLARTPEAPAASNTVQHLLDERGVVFTAMSTGTGIFRTQEHDRPILLAVGEALPGSDVVLVELTPDAAAFAYGGRTDVRHRLPLRP
jgi:hypothetical protein